jgi:hypothetical protein
MMTPTLREAAQAALTELDRLQPHNMGAYVHRARENLRAALAAQPAPDAPVATISECEACFTPDACQLRGTCDHYSAERLRIAKRAAPIAQQAAPAQARQPLTDAQIVVLAGSCADIEADKRGRLTYEFDGYGLVEFARAIEAAHGISAPAAQGVES